LHDQRFKGGAGQVKPNPAKAFSADPVSFRKVCFIGIIVVGCLALGAVLRSDTLADRFSPRGAEQLCSAGFFLSCMGGASAIWLLNALFFRRVAGARAMRAVCRMNEEAILWPWGLPVLAGLVFVLYWPALDLTFFADDFYILSLISNGPMRALLPVRDIYHYSPVALFLVAIPRWLGMGEPSIYHVLNIALHAVNGCLVYLLAEVTDVNTKDDNGVTALMEAAVGGRTDLVELLLNGGADVNMKDENGKTALGYAQKENHTEIVQPLRYAGAEE